MHHPTNLFKALLAIGSGCLSITATQAQSIMVTTAEGPTAFNTTLQGVNVEDFSGLTKGVYSNVNWLGVGTIDRVSLVPNNQYGGTPTSSYYPVQSSSGSLGGVRNTTITLNTSSSYFGMFWSAGDPYNDLKFYSGETLVGSFSTQSLMNQLPSTYLGNPNPAFKGQDRSEPFGFINFIGGTGTQWDQIVLSNPGTSGFESQNWTSRVAAWSPSKDQTLPGTPMVLIENTNGTIKTTSVVGSTVTVTGNTVTLTKPASPGSEAEPISISFAAEAPAAPAPPLALLIVFGGAFALRSLRGAQKG